MPNRLGEMADASLSTKAPGRARTVQSLERTFGLLERMANQDGKCSLSELAEGSGLPLATVHRLVGSLVDQGYVRRAGARGYVLGARLIRLGDAATRVFGSWARPHLVELAELGGETANLAMMEGDRVVYVAQSPGKHSMRMFTEPGRRVDPHCTAVGKVMLAQMSDRRVRQVLERTGMQRHTSSTITDLDALLEHLAVVRRHGYALDDGEQEVGVRCVAVALPASRTLAAVSLSAPTTRMTEQSMQRVLPAMIRVAEALSAEFNHHPP